MSTALPPFLMKSSDDPLPSLVRALRSRTPATRLDAVKAVGRLGWLAKDAIPALETALHDDDPKIREAAAHAIGQMGTDALPALARMLTHIDKYVRRNAVWALGKLGPLARPTLKQLSQSLRDADPRTASGAAQALGMMGADAAEAVPALAEAMRGTNIVLCRLAAKALSQIGTPALPTLIAHVKHSDPFVRGESALALGWMGALARAAVPDLIEALKMGGNPNRPAKLSANGAAAPGAPPPSRTPPPSPGDPKAVSDSARVHAAQALGRIGPTATAAIAELQRATLEGPEPLQLAARTAIRQIQGR